jgi:hypothetical protein
MIDSFHSSGNSSLFQIEIISLWIAQWTIQHTKHMRYIILPSVAHLDLPYFPHYLITGTIFRKNVTEHKMWVFVFSTTFSWTVLILKRIQQDIITNVYMTCCKVPIILVRSYQNLNFLDRLFKNPPISNFMKNCLAGAELFHVVQMEGPTDMTKLMVILQFCEHT